MDEKMTPDAPGNVVRPAWPEGTENKNRIAETAENVAHAGLEEAKNLASSMRSRVYQEVDSRRETVARKLERFAEDLEKMGASGDEDAQSRVVGGAARTVRDVSRTLRGSSTEELVRQAGRKIRERPGVFLAACLAIGFAGGRLLRQSSE